MHLYLIILRLILWEMHLTHNDENEVEDDLLQGLVASDYGATKGLARMMTMEIQSLSTQILDRSNPAYRDKWDSDNH